MELLLFNLGCVRDGRENPFKNCFFQAIFKRFGMTARPRFSERGNAQIVLLKEVPNQSKSNHKIAVWIIWRGQIIAFCE